MQGGNPNHDDKGRFASGSHSAGVQSAVPHVLAFHGTTQPFEGLPGEHSHKEYELLDRMLGPHYAADPDVSNSFVVKRVNGELAGESDGWGKQKDIGVMEGGRMFKVELPDDSKFLEVPQPKFAHAQPGWKDWEGRPSDQFEIERMIMKEAWKQDPGILERYLHEARAVPSDLAGKLARDMVGGKTVQLPLDGPHDLARMASNFGGRPYNQADREKAVNLARASWQKQGYKGLKYIDTAPMEMAHAKNPRAYVLFDPKDAKIHWGK